jgi:hypothetical protein
MHHAGLVFVLAGLFALAGAVFDRDWFMTHRKARFFVSVLGRTRTRLLYDAIGLGLVTLGLLAYFEVVSRLQ